MPIWGLQSGVGGIIWRPKFRGSRCAICGLRVELGKVICGLIFLVYNCPNHFLSIEVFIRNWTAVYLGSLKKFFRLFGGLKHA